ncbi:DUF1570 domain-containing protein [Alienimonas chondri]|uniref:DUF1570 domain-containing protein n=1 Tax=Alienimonas chondri TaxID=2681879 RepID=A0ABX1VDJ0_9PLAN|nr:DUF1570 domain-containing protein [Alienimonas chondri]NNJ26170.1 hypothetical protein [Alienimonas chondri]
MSVAVKLAFFLAALAAALCSSTALGAEPVGRSLIELTGPDGPVQGRLELRTNAAAWLTTDVGAMHAVPLAGVTAHRRVADRFAPLATHTAAARLRSECGPDGAVFASRRYLVVRHAARTPGTFGAKLERTYAAATGWFARHGVRPTEPEFPLIAVVHPDFDSFAEAAAADGAAPSARSVPRALKGYYSPTSNRLSVWEPRGGATPSPLEQEAFESTLIHEAVHQIAFNTGLHHRTGGTPRWVAEGLATALEAPAFLSASGSVKPADRANPGRLRDFRRRPHAEGYLDTLVFGEIGDDLSGRDPLTFYSEAWAFTFFLMHTRGDRYARYLRSVGDLTAASNDDPATRRAAFVQAFGTTPGRLEGEMARFVASL